jgi:eukaryotic-like serine/threonine-protein kinase
VPISAPEFAALNSLLDEALALDAEARKGWFYRLAEGRLKDMLREMLAQQSDLPDSDQPLSTLPKLGEDDANAHAGQRVGAYCLVREIGRGGMGSVWLAERADGNFERQIAVKLPRLAWMEGLGARMARERRIGALLEHPNIARMYDAGVDEHCRPFIAMEYIAGLAIDVYCKEHHLNVSARLRLFLQVVRAVAYAHGRLVIHRDLKPANVLVDAQGQAHLLDFGIAKLAGDVAQGGGLTQEQGRVLTPNYAAPEQIAGQPIGVAADVYSLGVMLYELLTGMLPYEPELLRASAAKNGSLDDVPRASSRVADKATVRALRGEVDSIVGKALKRDQKDRYATADGLADDIERQLAGDTVRAQPDSAWYRVRRAVRRHKSGLFGASAVMVALFAGGTALVQAHRAAVQFERTQVATAFVSDLFHSHPDSVAEDTDEKAYPHQAFLEESAKLIEVRFAGQPEMQSALYGIIGRVYADIGAAKLAIEYAHRQLGVLDSLQENVNARVRAVMLLADAHMQEEQYAVAEAHARRALQLSGSDSSLWLEALALLATIQLDSGETLMANATVLNAEQISQSRRLDPSIGLASLLGLQARLLVAQGKLEESRPIFQRALDIALRIEGPESRTASELRWQRALRLSYYFHRTEESKSLAIATLEAMRSNSTAGRVRAAVRAAEFWWKLYERGEVPVAEAMNVVSESRAVIAAQHTFVPPIVQARLDFALGGIYLDWTDVQQAQRWMSTSGPVIKATSTKNLNGVILQEARLAMVMGDHDKADSILRPHLKTVQRTGMNSRDLTSSWLLFVNNLRMKGNFDAAEAALDQMPAPELGQLVQSRSTTYYANVDKILRAQIKLDRGDASTAATLLRESVNLSPAEQRYWAAEAVYGEVACATGHTVEGLELLIDNVKQLSDGFGKNEKDPELARVRAAAGLCALALGDHPAALKFAQLSRSAFTAQPGVSPYYKEPLDKLERALAVPAEGSSKSDSQKTAAARQADRSHKRSRNRWSPNP